MNVSMICLWAMVVVVVCVSSSGAFVANADPSELDSITKQQEMKAQETRAAKKDLVEQERMDRKTVKNMSEEKRDFVNMEKKHAETRAEEKKLAEQRRIEKKLLLRSEGGKTTELKGNNQLGDKNMKYKNSIKNNKKSDAQKLLQHKYKVLKKKSTSFKKDLDEETQFKHAQPYMKEGRTREERRALKKLHQRMKRATLGGKLPAVQTKGLLHSRRKLKGTRRFSEEDTDYYSYERKDAADTADEYNEVDVGDVAEEEYYDDYYENYLEDVDPPQLDEYNEVDVGDVAEYVEEDIIPLPPLDETENEIFPALPDDSENEILPALPDDSENEISYPDEPEPQPEPEPEIIPNLVEPVEPSTIAETPVALSTDAVELPEVATTESYEDISFIPFIPPHLTEEPDYYFEPEVVSMTEAPLQVTTAESVQWPWQAHLAGSAGGQCGVAVFGPENRASTRDAMLKILAGKEALPGSFPWQVAILDEDRDLMCGGTLIAPRWVMTAAHCIRKKLYVRLLEHHMLQKDGQEVEQKVRRIFRHEGYNQSTIDNDIALLRLPALPPFEDEDTGEDTTGVIDTACLPVSSDDFPDVGTRCLVMGWGKPSISSRFGTDVLMYTRLPIISRKACVNANRKIITENMFCAGHYKGGADTCSGDSGGPLLCSKTLPSGGEAWTVYGITSFGDGCGNAGKMGVYSKVNNYLDWMADIMGRY